MNKRPFSIIIISWLFIAVGVVALAYHSTHLNDKDIVWVLIVRFLAVVAGAGMLFRQNWARWLTAAWLAYHVFLSVQHAAIPEGTTNRTDGQAIREIIVHAVLFVVIVFFLFCRSSTAYFRRANPSSSPS